MWFFTLTTLKTVDDHCGYALPFDPLQRVTGNNAGYHDVHHQSWGVKTNFSQPFFTFWDRVLGTKWVGGDVSVRYEKAKVAAQKAVDMDITQKATVTNSSATESKISPPGALYENDRPPSSVPSSQQQPYPPEGKATFQAAGSRQQVLDDKAAGGIQVLMAESKEEKEAESVLRRSPRKRAKSSSKETLAGLRERVSGKGAHGRGVGVMGVGGGEWKLM